MNRENIGRTISLHVRVTPAEHAMIREKMALFGAECMAAYMRKMAIDGYIINLDMPELREISTLLHRAGGNINQIARCTNQTGRVYEDDIQEILNSQKKLLTLFGEVLKKLSRLK